MPVVVTSAVGALASVSWTILVVMPWAPGTRSKRSATSGNSSLNAATSLSPISGELASYQTISPSDAALAASPSTVSAEAARLAAANTVPVSMAANVAGRPMVRFDVMVQVLLCRLSDGVPAAGPVLVNRAASGYIGQPSSRSTGSP